MKRKLTNLKFLAEVTNPKLIVAVGTAGLISNIVGLFLFHDHGHSHGGGGHGHSHGGGSSKPAAKSTSHSHSHSESSHSHSEPTDRTPLLSTSSNGGANGQASSPSGASSTVIDEDDESSELGEAEDAIEEELLIHPGELRANVLKKAHDAGYGATSQPNHKKGQNSLASLAESGHGDSHDHDHAGHGDHGGEAPSEGNMNMRGVFLHVLGDAVRLSLPPSPQAGRGLTTLHSH